jgi:hypothetical protein
LRAVVPIATGRSQCAEQRQSQPPQSPWGQQWSPAGQSLLHRPRFHFGHPSRPPRCHPRRRFQPGCCPQRPQPHWPLARSPGGVIPAARH